MNSGDRPPQRPPSRLFAGFFWGSIVAMAVVSLGLVGISWLRSDPSPAELQVAPPAVEREPAPHELKIEPGRLQRALNRATDKAAAATSAEIEQWLGALFDPVYGGISRYAEFHYTILGEYTELVGAALGTSAEAIQSRLYGGFTERLERLATTMNTRFADAFQAALKQELEAEIPTELGGVPLAPVTQRAIEDALSRARVTAPVGTVMATVGGAAAMKAVSKTIAAKVGTKVAAKAAGKGVAKGGGVLGGTGLGALGGAWAGPVGAAVGGVIGGVTAWFAVDAAVITLDEYFNRDEFEADLRLMVDEHRDVVRGQLKRFVTQQSEQMKGSFTLQELSRE